MLRKFWDKLVAFFNQRQTLNLTSLCVGSEWRNNKKGEAIAFKDQVQTAFWVLRDFGNFDFWSRQREIEERLEVDEVNKSIGLDLWGLQITDERLKRLYGLVNLKVLRLSDTQITNAGLKHLSGFKELMLLSLERTNITDKGLKSLRGLVGLTDLGLTDTKITDRSIYIFFVKHEKRRELRVWSSNGARITWNNVPQKYKDQVSKS